MLASNVSLLTCEFNQATLLVSPRIDSIESIDRLLGQHMIRWPLHWSLKNEIPIENDEDGAMQIKKKVIKAYCKAIVNHSKHQYRLLRHKPDIKFALVCQSNLNRITIFVNMTIFAQTAKTT